MDTHAGMGGVADHTWRDDMSSRIDAPGVKDVIGVKQAMRHPADGRLHFSELKAHAECPRMVVHACSEARDLTRAMLVGGITDSLVFASGRGHALYPGPRRAGKEWDEFKVANPGKYLCIQSELDEAVGAAQAVLAHPVARDLLDGAEFQRVARWEAYGLPCASGIAGERGGFDAIHLSHKRRRPFIADLKTTVDTEPRAFSRHAESMLWHAQGRWFLDGAHALDIDVHDFYLIGVRSKPPHIVTVLQVPARALDIGGMMITKWTERHKACEAAGEWPEYVQDVTEMTLRDDVLFDE
jgi:hypothetical protein